MALTINNSIASINAQRHLSRATSDLGKTFARLASGRRINTSKDDAAGLAISQRMMAGIRGMGAAVRNANDGISLAQVAEGALEETTNALIRMRELAVQAANSTYGEADRNNLQEEFTQMLSEIERIASTTEFNGVNLMGGHRVSGTVSLIVSALTANFHIGQDTDQTITVSIKSAGLQGLGLVSFTTNATEGSIYNTTNFVSIGGTATSYANSALQFIDSALDSVSSIRATLGSAQSRFETIISSLSNLIENTDSARSRIMDADIAVETANLTRATILQQAGVAILAQANQQPTIALALLAG